MQVTYIRARSFDRTSSQHRLRGEIERYMKDEATPLRAQASKKAEVILDVLEDVEAKDQIERWNIRFYKIPLMKGEASALSRAAQRDGLRRDVPAFDPRNMRQRITNATHDLAGSASDLGDRFRSDSAAIEQRDDLFRFPRRIFDVVTGIQCGISPIGIAIVAHGPLYTPDRRSCAR